MTVHLAPPGDPAAELPEDPAATDSLVVTYWNFVCDRPAEVPIGVARTAVASTALLEDTFNTAAHHGTNLSRTRTALARNPNCPLGVLREFLLHPTGGERANAAAMNPTTGPWATGVWDMVEPGVARRFLANPACPPELLVEHFRRDPRAVLANPACPPDLVAEYVTDGRYPRVWSSPHVPPDELRHQLLNGDPDVRVAAMWNPTLTVGDLTVALRHATEGGSEALASIATHRLERLRWVEDPFDCPAADMEMLGYSPVVAAALSSLGEGVIAEAAAALHARGFAGTVGELLEVASTFTD